MSSVFGQVRDRWARSDFARSSLTLIVALILIYLVAAPLVFLLFGSVFTGRPGGSGTLSFDNYAQIVTNPRSYRIFLNSFIYGVASAVVSFVVGASIAWFVRRTDLPGRKLFTFIALLPLFVPTVLTTVGWVLLLDENVGLLNRGLQPLLGTTSGPFDIFTFAGMVWVRGVLDVPLVMLWLWPALSAMDPGLEEAAATSGSSPAKVIRTITIPLIRPALLAAFLISFVTSIEDVAVPLFIGLRAGVDVFAGEIYLAAQTLPRDIHLASGYGVVLLAVTMSLMLIYRRLTFSTERFVTIRGRGYRPSLIALGRWRLPIAIGMAVMLFILIVLPILVLVWTSLSPFVQVPTFDGFARLNLDSYERMLSDPGVIRGMTNSLIYGLVTGLIVMVLALAAGWIVIRTRSRAAGFLDFVGFAPLAIPGLVIGIALVWLYLTLPVGIYGTGIILILAYVTILIPYGMRLAYSGFTQLHPELEEAASVSGAGWLKSLRTIAAPLLLPTLLVGAIYVFLRAFRELPASLILSSFYTEPYSVVAFRIWTAGDPTKMAAYGVVAILLVTIVVVVLQRFRGGPTPES